MGYDAEVLGGSVRTREVMSRFDRIFVTTSRRWFDTLSKKGLKVVLVPRESWEDQLCALIKQLGIKPSLELNRCPFCGRALVRAGEDLVKSRVPPKALETAKDFTYCANCDHLFWKGLHYERMKSMLESALSRC